MRDAPAPHPMTGEQRAAWAGVRTGEGTPKDIAGRSACIHQNKLSLPGADEVKVDIRKNFRIEKRAMLGATRIVDPVTRTEIIETIRAGRMLSARQQQRIDEALAL